MLSATEIANGSTRFWTFRKPFSQARMLAFCHLTISLNSVDIANGMRGDPYRGGRSEKSRAKEAALRVAPHSYQSKFWLDALGATPFPWDCISSASVPHLPQITASSEDDQDNFPCLVHWAAAWPSCIP